MSDYTYQTYGSVDAPDPYERVRAIAKRLGVEPLAPGGPATVMIRLKDGTQYDYFQLIEAFLDKVDTALVARAERDTTRA